MSTSGTTAFSPLLTGTTAQWLSYNALHIPAKGKPIAQGNVIYTGCSRQFGQGVKVAAKRDGRLSCLWAHDPSHRESTINPTAQRLMAYAERSRPFRNGFCFTVPRQIYTTAPVPALLALGCPTDICRFVMPVVIDAIHRQTVAPSIGEIRDEIANVVPSLANRYPTPAVIFVRRISAVIAAVHHEIPRLIKPVPRKAMSGLRGTPNLQASAPAACAIAAPKFVSKHFAFNSAVTAAKVKPVVATKVKTRTRKHSPSLEFFPYNFDFLHMRSMKQNTLER